jgi:hypothetical protein
MPVAAGTDEPRNGHHGHPEGCKTMTERTEEFLTLFEKERGFAFTRSARFFNSADVAPLAAKTLAIAKAEKLDLADAADRVAPSVWDEPGNHYTCAYDLRKAIVKHLTKSKR